MKIKCLKKMPYSNAHIKIYDDGTIELWSCRTLVVVISYDGWCHVYGLYSRTTRRHIGAFAAEYIKYPNGTNGTYQDMKAMYTGSYEMNIHTGEIVEY